MCDERGGDYEGVGHGGCIGSGGDHGPEKNHHNHYYHHYRLLTNRGPDRSGSCLILIRQPPDRSGCRLILIWQVPDRSGSPLVSGSLISGSA